jgi:ubiquinone/menaquinone biosynthesis C-methylase UbiE
VVAAQAARDRVTEVHPAARGFERAADEYDRGRPGYPPPAVSWLIERLGVQRGARVVDLAAGTGKLTRELAATGAEVVAVEPARAMRARLEATLPAVEAREGTAEAIPLPESSADAITVAQAFHWFDQERAIAEIHRVLRPQARLGLVWNHRDLSDPVQAALDKLVNRYRYDTPAERDQRWREAFAATPLFTPLVQRDFRNVQHVDADGLVDRIASTSFVATLSDEMRDPFLAEVRALAPPDGRVTLPYRTGVYVCQAV